MKALVTGGTGLLGSELLASLSDGGFLSRDPVRTTRKLGHARAVRYDPATEAAPLEALQGVEAIFNLAGEPVAESLGVRPVPKAALRIAFGEMSEVLRASQRALPRVAERTGYAFKHTELEGALAAVMAAPQRTAA